MPFVYPWTPGGGTTTPPTTGGSGGLNLLTGLGVPDSSLGVEAQKYIDTTPGAGQEYVKTGGAWVLTGGSLRGPASPYLTSAGLDGLGHLVLTRSDGATFDAGLVRGGPGADGIGISGTAIVAKHLIVTYSNGTTQDLGVVVGADGTGGGSGYAPDGTPPTSVSVPSTTTATSLTGSMVAALVYVTGGDVYVDFASTTPTTSSTRWQAGETYEVTTNAELLALRFIKASGTPVLKVQSEV